MKADSFNRMHESANLNLLTLLFDALEVANQDDIRHSDRVWKDA